MAISFDSALGFHEKALLLRESRAQILASNLANSETPGFKARDLDFADVLRQAAGAEGNGLTRTQANHLSAQGIEGLAPNLKYRAPTQPSIDGNTVDDQIEMAEFAKNTLDFQASLTFLQSSLRGLKSAIRGD